MFGRKRTAAEVPNVPAEENFVKEEYLVPSAETLLLEQFSGLKKRFGRLALVLLVITVVSGFQTVWFNKKITGEIVAGNRIVGQIDKELANMKKRAQDLAALYELEPSISVQTQFTVLTTALNNTGYIVKNLEYNSADNRYAVVRDAFLVETGRALDTIDKAGLWSIEVFNQQPDIVQTSRRFAGAGNQILEQIDKDGKLFVVTSGGSSARGTSQIVLHVMFWKGRSK